MLYIFTNQSMLYDMDVEDIQVLKGLEESARFLDDNSNKNKNIVLKRLLYLMDQLVKTKYVQSILKSCPILLFGVAPPDPYHNHFLRYFLGKRLWLQVQGRSQKILISKQDQQLDLDPYFEVLSGIHFSKRDGITFIQQGDIEEYLNQPSTLAILNNYLKAYIKEYIKKKGKVMITLPYIDFHQRDVSWLLPFLNRLTSQQKKQLYVVLTAPLAHEKYSQEEIQTEIKELIDFYFEQEKVKPVGEFFLMAKKLNNLKVFPDSIDKQQSYIFPEYGQLLTDPAKDLERQSHSAYKKLMEIPKIKHTVLTELISHFYETFSCESVIKAIQGKFEPMAKNAPKFSQIITIAQICSSFVEKNQFHATIRDILNFQRKMGNFVEDFTPETEFLLQKLFDVKLSVDQVIKFDHSLKEEYKKLAIESEIQQISSRYLKQFSCELLINIIKAHFVQQVENGATFSQLLTVSEICSQFTRKNNKKSTIPHILDFLKKLGVPTAAYEPEVAVSKLFGYRMEIKRTIKLDHLSQVSFDHSLKDKYNSLVYYEIQKTFLKRFTCESVIKEIREKFVQLVEHGAQHSQLLAVSEMCSQFVKKSQNKATIQQILAFYKNIQIPTIDYQSDLQISELFGEKLSSKKVFKIDQSQEINFHHSLKEEYDKLGIKNDISKIMQIISNQLHNQHRQISLNSLIKLMKESFIKKIQMGKANYQLLRQHVQACQKFCNNNQHQATVKKIFDFQQLIGVSINNQFEQKDLLSQIFGTRLSLKKMIKQNMPTEIIKFDRSLKQEYTKLQFEAQISKIVSKFLKQFTCEFMIKKIRQKFVQEVENTVSGSVFNRMIQVSKFCSNFVNQHEFKSTIGQILLFLQGLKLPSSIDFKQPVSEIFGQKLSTTRTVKMDDLLGQNQEIKFEHSLKEEYNKLGIQEFLVKKQTRQYSQDGSKLIISGAFIELDGWIPDKKLKSVQIRTLVQITFMKDRFPFFTNISIIAPVWETFWPRTIFFLIGEDGVNYQNRAKDGEDLTRPGITQADYDNPIKFKQSFAHDGLPGKPGNPGFSFYGLGLSGNTSPCQLVPYSRGGHGGNGQDAGNGALFKFEMLDTKNLYPWDISHYDLLIKIREELVYPRSGKRGSKGIGAPGGAISTSFKKYNNLIVTYKNQVGNDGKEGKQGTPGSVKFSWGEVVSVNTYNEVISNTLPNPPGIILGYQCVINYENYLFQQMNCKGIQRDIAFANLVKIISLDWSRPPYSPEASCSRMEIKHLIDEMNLITKMYTKFLFESDFVTSQQMGCLVSGFKQKLVEYIKKFSDEMTYIQDQVTRKISANLVIIEKSMKMAHTVLNFEYLKYFLKNTSFQNNTALQKYTRAKKQFITKIDNKIKQAETVTDDLQKQVDSLIEKLYQESSKLQEQMKKQQAKKDEYAKKLQEQLPWRLGGKILGFVGKIVSNFGPEGQVVGAVAGGASGVIDILAPPPKPLSGKDLSPATYLGMDNGLDIEKAAQVIDGLRSIDPSIPSYEDIKKQLNTNQGIKKFLDSVQKGLKETKDAFKKITDANKKMRQAEAKQNQKKDKNDKPDPQKIKEQKEVKQKKNKLLTAQNALKMIGIASDGAAVIKDCINACDQVSKAQQDANQFEKNRNQIKDFINGTMRNFMQKMSHANQLYSEAGSQARVLFLQYGFKGTLNDILQYLKNSLEKYNSPVKNDFFYIFTKIQSATQTLSQIYGVIDNYKSQGELGNLVLGVTQPMNKKQYDEYPGLLKMEEDFNNLMVYKQGNDILNSFKQSAFPKSPFYSYNAYYKITEKNLNDSVKEMMKELKDLYKAHMMSKSMIGQESQAFITTDKKAVFYTIKQNFTIANLLLGEVVSILPDVRLSHKTRDAIKFKSINIKFELESDATEQMKASFNNIQQKLLNEDNGVTVEMASSGNYFYRYCEVYYNFPSVQLFLKRSYNPQGSITNDVQNIVSSGEPMFSPYTSWRIQLKELPFKDPIFKADVEKCRSKLKLKFYGAAMYIDQSSFNSQASVIIPVHECYKAFEAKILTILPQG